MPLRIGDILLDARNEHTAFTRERHGNRTLVDYLSERHRVYYKQLADELKDRLSTARDIAAVIAGTLVGIDAAGNPYVVPSGADGYAVGVGVDGLPYALTGVVISLDPFNDGFVLPADSLQIIAIWASLSTAHERVPVSWLPQPRRAQFTTGERLAATVNGFRLLPLINPDGVQSLWDSVESVTVSYVPEPAELDGEDPATLNRAIEIPTVYGHVLKWELTAFMARREAATNKEFPAALVKFYADEAVRARETTATGAVMDHRIIKQHRTTRNR